MFVILSGILTMVGCSKEKDTPAPVTPPPTTPAPVTPPSYSKFKINEVVVTDMPTLNSSGNAWDFSTNPDIYFKITNSTNTLFDGISAYMIDFNPANLPTGWTFSTPYIVNNLTESFFIDLYDNDTNDFPSNADDLIGYVSFNMSSYTSTYPTSVSRNYNGLYIKLNGTWSN